MFGKNKGKRLNKKEKLLLKTTTLILTLLLLVAIFYNQIIISYALMLVLGASIFSSVGKILSQSVKLKKELRKNLYVDLKTGLPNRQQLLKDKKRLDPHNESTLIIINIDSFQNTNNFYGHDFGDAFL